MSVFRLIFFFAYRCPVIPTPLVCMSFLHCVAFARLSKISYVGISLGYSGPLIYMPILLPIPHCLDYCSFIVSLVVKYCQSSMLFPFNIMLVILSILPLYINFKISLCISTKNLLGFWLALHWTYRSSWKELISWQYWVFLSMRTWSISPFT